jgi:hypothetical protein
MALAHGLAEFIVCGPRMFIPDPGFIPFRITDPKITKMRKGGKN